MKKKLLLVFSVFTYFITCCFADSFSLTLDGNAHIFSYNDFKKIYSYNVDKYSANELFRAYERLLDSCGNNELLFDQKCETDFANQLIKISGYVKQVRKSILDEYIVVLGTTDTWAWDIGVVYPKRISSAMINELMTLKQGDYFEALAITRNTYLYVDVPVWNSNGTYRTEP